MQLIPQSTNETPEGFTRKGMPPGWIVPKRNPTTARLLRENRELRDMVVALAERLAALEENKK